MNLALTSAHKASSHGSIEPIDGSLKINENGNGGTVITVGTTELAEREVANCAANAGANAGIKVFVKNAEKVVAIADIPSAVRTRPICVDKAAPIVPVPVSARRMTSRVAPAPAQAAKGANKSVSNKVAMSSKVAADKVAATPLNERSWEIRPSNNALHSLDLMITLSTVGSGHEVKEPGIAPTIGKPLNVNNGAGVIGVGGVAGGTPNTMKPALHEIVKVAVMITPAAFTAPRVRV
jgi:hypothetical protein